MATDLYGDLYADNWDYARKLVTKGASTPFYKFDCFVANNSCKILFTDNNNEQVLSSKFDEPGIYCIYNIDEYENKCLYVGMSNRSVRNRLYRFSKEFNNMSRKDETHPAAKKIKLHGYDHTKFFVKFISMKDFPRKGNICCNFDTIDETIAILLKSRYNRNKRY